MRRLTNEMDRLQLIAEELYDRNPDLDPKQFVLLIYINGFVNLRILTMIRINQMNQFLRLFY